MEGVAAEIIVRTTVTSNNMILFSLFYLFLFIHGSAAHIFAYTEFMMVLYSRNMYELILSF